MSVRPTNISVLVSGHGRGTTLQAIMDACADGRISGRVAVVIGVKDDVPAMDRARDNGIPAIALRPKESATDEEYGRRILEVLSEHEVDLICLAGYMRVLPLEVVRTYQWRIMNTHAALIPAFCGQGMYGEHVPKAILDYGVKVSGCTIHFVDEVYDHGPIIVQKCVAVEEGDTPETLAARVLPFEHAAYIEAIQLSAEGRLRVEGRVVRVLPRE